VPGAVGGDAAEINQGDEMKPIQPVDEIRQDSDLPPTEPDATAGYVVVDVDGVPQYFEDFEPAERFAQRQAEYTEEEKWSVFPLYAAEPITVT
jgi:hypothetical protein